MTNEQEKEYYQLKYKMERLKNNLAEIPTNSLLVDGFIAVYNAIFKDDWELLEKYTKT